MRYPSRTSWRTLAVLSLFISGALNFAALSSAFASANNSPSIANNGDAAPPSVSQDDSVRMLKLTAPKNCCGHYRKTKRTKVEQNCEVKVDVQYCYTRIVNNVPISFCYWTHQTVKGKLNTTKQCCEVTLKDINGKTYCVPPGSTITIGPIPTAQNRNSVPVEPPIYLVESFEGGRRVLRVVPGRWTPEEQSDVYIYSGDRLVIQKPELSAPSVDQQ